MCIKDTPHLNTRLESVEAKVCVLGIVIGQEEVALFQIQLLS
jgi:hypothetical protein